MKNSLSLPEIDAIIDKLRVKYDEHEKKYGAFYFNKKSFEDRYLDALRKKINLQAFAYAEVTAFEEMKKRFEQRQEEYKIKKDKPFSKKIERIFEELSKRIIKYPLLFKETDLFIEGQYFCGALLHFYNSDWLNLTKMIDKSNLAILKSYNNVSTMIGNFIFSTKIHPSLEVENYLLNLHKSSENKAKILFLKQSVSVTKEIKKVLQMILDFLKEKEQKEKVKVILENVNQIIYDFRLTDLVKIKGSLS